MIDNIEKFQKIGKEQFETAVKSLDVFSKGIQAISAEATDFSKKTFEDGTAAVEKLISAKNPEEVFETQSTYAKKAYENFVTQSTKVGEMYVDLMKESYKPFEAMFPRSAK